MNRHLDGIYLRVERNGKWQDLCLSDMTQEELERTLDPKKGEWLKGAVIHLAQKMRYIGDQMDIEMVREEDANED